MERKSLKKGSTKEAAAIAKKARETVPLQLGGKIYHSDRLKILKNGKWANTAEMECYDAVKMATANNDWTPNIRQSLTNRRNTILLDFLCDPCLKLKDFAERLSSLSRCVQDNLNGRRHNFKLRIAITKIRDACQGIPKNRRPTYRRNATRRLSLVEILETGGNFHVTEDGFVPAKNNNSYALNLPIIKFPLSKKNGKSRQEEIKRVLNEYNWTGFFP